MKLSVGDIKAITTENVLFVVSAQCRMYMDSLHTYSFLLIALPLP
jgi:hypothetical protein